VNDLEIGIMEIPYVFCFEKYERGIEKVVHIDICRHCYWFDKEKRCEFNHSLEETTNEETN